MQDYTALTIKDRNGERVWETIRAVGDSLRHRHALYHAHAHRHAHVRLVHAWHQQLTGVHPLPTPPL